MKVRDKRTYEIPLMTVSLVELEGAVCGSVVDYQNNNSKVESTGHEIGGTFDLGEASVATDDNGNNTFWN